MILTKLIISFTKTKIRAFIALIFWQTFKTNKQKN